MSLKESLDDGYVANQLGNLISRLLMVQHTISCSLSGAQIAFLYIETHQAEINKNGKRMCWGLVLTPDDEDCPNVYVQLTLPLSNSRRPVVELMCNTAGTWIANLMPGKGQILDRRLDEFFRQKELSRDGPTVISESIAKEVLETMAKEVSAD